ncbi:unnamed protein product [Ectocarpus sp. CCAP 1310/34]|nr:unnamed protein product [Ectocarpus sp. CCAP 1310/34]
MKLNPPLHPRPLLIVSQQKQATFPSQRGRGQACQRQNLYLSLGASYRPRLHSLKLGVSWHYTDTMSSGKVELLGDNVEFLDYEPEGGAPPAGQFPAAGAEDESPPMSMVFIVDDLLDNIATADPAELERAYNTGRVCLEDIVEAAHLSTIPPFSLLLSRSRRKTG